ncbi:MAG: SRPBCC family protein [Acidimicrobiales bacterium]|nr:SRPBCC family protein [Acidimicrobiales bacterium]
MLRRIARSVATSAPGTNAAYLAYGLARPALLRPSVTPAEARLALPGDHLVPVPQWVATRGVTIQAPPHAVWPWLVQMGFGRAGWYSWYRFDDDGRPSADHLEPALQQLAVGDPIPDGPRADEGMGVWRVAVLEADRALALYSCRHPVTGREVDPLDPHVGPYVESSWAFVLRPGEHGDTRLLVRVRATVAPRWARPLFGLVGAADTVMEHTMLDGIRLRAERRVPSASPGPVHAGDL